MPHYLSSLEWNVRPAQFRVFGFNGNCCLASMETVAWRITQIVEAYSGEGGKPRLAGVQYHEGRTSAEDCIDPNLRAAVAEKTREELDLENLRGRFTGVTGAGQQGGAATGGGDGADGEGTFCRQWRRPPKTAGSRPGGSDAMTVSQASGEGTTAGRIRFHLSVTPGS